MNYIVLDTETTNGFDDPITYDVGWAVLDKDFRIVETRSYVVADIFLDEKQLMKEAYFADKIPQYWEDIKNGTKELKTFYNIRKAFHEDCKNYDVTIVVAHNARFDYLSCSTTQRWLTSSKYRYFFPYGTKIVCSLEMAKQIFAHDADYISFCREHENYMRSKNYPRLTAEILFQYLSSDDTFSESHTALEDVKIEAKIFEYCVKHGAELRSPWAK